MKENRLFFLPLAWSIFLLLSACVPSMDIKYDPLAKTDAKRGTVVIGEINNKRPHSYGGQNFGLLGKIRGGYGNPFDLQTEAGKEINIVLRDISKNILDHTGYDSAGTGRKGPRLDIDVNQFWCDGYGNSYTIEVDLAIKLIDPVNDKVLVRRAITFDRKVKLSTPGKTREAFDIVFNEIQKLLLAFVQSNDFRSAVR